MQARTEQNQNDARELYQEYNNRMALRDIELKKIIRPIVEEYRSEVDA